jgi:hypothetical protein
MGRGLSPEQRAILGLAVAVNRATQGGTLAVKPGKPDYLGPRDVSLRLAVWAIGGFVPLCRYIVSPRIFYEGTPAYLAMKASLSRAIGRLVKRGLLANAPSWHWPIGLDYVLTAEGIEAGAPYEKRPALLDSALQTFCMVLPGPEIVARSRHDEPGREYDRVNQMIEQGRTALGCPNGKRCQRKVPSVTNSMRTQTVNAVVSRDFINRYRKET